MDSKSDISAKDSIQWYKMLATSAGVIILSLLYLLFPPIKIEAGLSLTIGQKCILLFQNAIPSAIVVLLSATAIYWLVYKREPTENRAFNLPCEDDGWISELSNKICKTIGMENKSKYPMLFEFHESFLGINWPELLNGSTRNIDIVVYYFDSWVNSNFEALVAYFRKPNTRMRVFVANPDDKQILENIHRLFPDRTQDDLYNKVNKTGTRILQALDRAGATHTRLEFYHFPHFLNYSAQCIDNRILVLSIFEMFRTTRIDSPAIVVDLDKSEHLRQYWDKELKGLLDNSERIRPKV